MAHLNKGNVITINIVSETICPWCFIGKRRLDRAIQAFATQHPGTKFEIRWKPFYLNRGMDRSASFDKQYYYKLLLRCGYDSPLASPSPSPSPAPTSTPAGFDSRIQGNEAASGSRDSCQAEAARTGSIAAGAREKSPGDSASSPSSQSSEEDGCLKSRSLIIAAAAGELGIEINLFGRTGWTRDSHKLILLAGMVDAERLREIERRKVYSMSTGGGGAHQYPIWTVGDTRRVNSSGNGSASKPVYHTPSPSLHDSEMATSDITPPAGYEGEMDYSDDELTPSPPEKQRRTLSTQPQSTKARTGAVADYIINPLQHTLVDRLFTSHFSAGEDLSWRPFLLSIAKSLDLLSHFTSTSSALHTTLSSSGNFTPHASSASTTTSTCREQQWDDINWGGKSPSHPHNRPSLDTAAGTDSRPNTGILTGTNGIGTEKPTTSYTPHERTFLKWLDCPDTAALVDDMEASIRNGSGSSTGEGANAVKGIPTFDIQGRFRIGGAQTEEVFLDVFERVRRSQLQGKA
ncbi:hypothetical protein MKZ38_001590 [Zalerion maritima]|uniref:DSBA-like thioredoxin domain-containing protein n=1 Tax=Zalerion maritima TaxID=339359 RepID=A0AAD5RR00_9PEZI|nr:hypothetical protein MKZ38_001590 [Zalerion maritima]